MSCDWFNFQAREYYYPETILFLFVFHSDFILFYNFQSVVSTEADLDAAVASIVKEIENNSPAAVKAAKQVFSQRS